MTNLQEDLLHPFHGYIFLGLNLVQIYFPVLLLILLALLKNMGQKKSNL